MITTTKHKPMNQNQQLRTPKSYLDQLREQVRLKDVSEKQRNSQSPHGLPQLLDHINTEHRENVE